MLYKEANEVNNSRLGVRESGVQGDNAVTMYPNPTKSIVYFDLVVAINPSVIVQSVNGATVLSQDLTSQSSVDVSALLSGIYIVTLTSEDQTYTYKLIIE